MSNHGKVLVKDKEDYFGMPSMEGMEKNPELENEKKVSIDIEDAVENISVSHNMTWIVLWIALGLSVAAFVFTFDLADAIVTILILIGTILLSKKLKGFEIDSEKRHYMKNLCHTLKAFLIRVIGFKMFYVNRKRNALIAAGVLFIEQPILRAWLYYPISAGIHYVALIVLFLSLLCTIASKEFDVLAKLTGMIGISQAISIFLICVFFHYVAIETILIAITLAVLSSWSRLFVVDTVEESQESQNR